MNFGWLDTSAMRGNYSAIEMISTEYRLIERLFLAVPRGCLQFVIVVFPDHTYLLFFIFDNCPVWFYRLLCNKVSIYWCAYLVS